MSIHDGHRDRVKKRFLDHGLENFDDHTVVELLLYYTIPRSDTNPVAHALLDRFGSLSAMFDAPIEELTKVPGVGQASATLIKLIPQISRRYLVSRTSDQTILSSTKAAGRYFVPRFFAERDEVVYLACLDSKHKVLNCSLLCRGGVSSIQVNIRKLVETALAYNATRVILAHNHVSGVALPSESDKVATRHIQQVLQSVDITLIDHIVVADNDFVSMADSGMMEQLESDR